ncbi:MAG: FAD-binding oxidoreductase [Hyphomonadaceae bacterium]|nr:FAD-binding oxidoreductase [Hyphomonadaceae bacterium]
MSLENCINELRAKMPDICSDDADILAPHLVEWRDRWQGSTPLLISPKSTQEVAEIVKICGKHKSPLTVQGGNTGLCGGQIPQGEILLSTQRLNKIRHADKDNMNIVCESGVTLLEAQQAANAIGLKFPLSLASEGTCTIGGNLSTNAGGIQVLKYGTAKELVFGVEAVLANGEIYNGLSSLRKDNTGYDLSRLLLGAEGTLGIITAASLKLSAKPREVVRVMVAVASPEKAVAFMNHARIGTHLAMFEFIPRLALEYVTTNIPDQRDPFANKHSNYVLLDWEFDQAGHGQDFANDLLETALEQNLIEDAVVAQSEAQAAALLNLRENLSASQKPVGATVKHDITVELAKTPEFIKRANKAMLDKYPDCHPLPFGHFGDGNIHYNVGQPKGMESRDFMALEGEINEIIYDIVDDLGGSISAEHGIGILKKDQLEKRADAAKMRTMRTLKTALDPDGILNPRILF